LLKHSLDVAVDPARKCPIFSKAKLKVVLGALGLDGMAIKPELAWVASKMQWVGAHGLPKTAWDALEDIDLADLAKRLYVEAGLLVITTVDNKLAFIVGNEAATRAGDATDLKCKGF